MDRIKMESVTIREELEGFEWINARWTADRFIAASPFRYDRTPSFFVDLRPGAYFGCWHDSGASDLEWSGGSFPKLLAFLMNVTYEEAVEYLAAKYGDGDSPETITLRVPNLSVPERKEPLDIRILEEYNRRHSYLTSRGISEAVQRMMRIGYDQQRKAVVIPWFNPDGTLANVKFRKITEKTFWYARNGRRLSELIYGMNVICERRLKRALLVESETCALYALTHGYAAIANGGSEFSEYKAELIRKSPLEELYVATDNDAAGEKLRQQIHRKLAGYVALKDVRIPSPYKDVNDVKDAEILTEIVKTASAVNICKITLACPEH